MKQIICKPPPLRPLAHRGVVALNTNSGLAQGTGFNSTDLKTGISNILAVIMMFGFVLGISRHLRRLRHPARRR